MKTNPLNRQVKGKFIVIILLHFFPKLTKLHEDKSLLVDINWKNYFPYFSVFPHSLQCFSFSQQTK